MPRVKKATTSKNSKRAKDIDGDTYVASTKRAAREMGQKIGEMNSELDVYNMVERSKDFRPPAAMSPRVVSKVEYSRGGKISKRATRRASEEAYNKREKRYDKRELKLLGKGKTAKASRYADRKIAKEERILRRAGY